MAAALLSHALAAQPKPLRSLEVISAGVSARGGEPATNQAITALKKVGISISGHVSRPVTQELLDGAVAVFCMTESHRAMIQAMADPVPKNLLLFREGVKTGGKEIAIRTGARWRSTRPAATKWWKRFPRSWNSSNNSQVTD